MQAASTVEYRSLYEQQLEANNLLRITVASLQQQLSQLQKMMFASKHERFVPTGVNPSQLSLNIQADQTATCSVVDAKKISYIKTKTVVEQKPLVHPGRMKLPEHLRREEITIEPTEDITSCKKMGEEITEVLEWWLLIRIYGRWYQEAVNRYLLHHL